MTTFLSAIFSAPDALKKLLGGLLTSSAVRNIIFQMIPRPLDAMALHAAIHVSAVLALIETEFSKFGAQSPPLLTNLKQQLDTAIATDAGSNIWKLLPDLFTQIQQEVAAQPNASTSPDLPTRALAAKATTVSHEQAVEAAQAAAEAAQAQLEEAQKALADAQAAAVAQFAPEGAADTAAPPAPGE